MQFNSIVFLGHILHYFSILNDISYFGTSLLFQNKIEKYKLENRALLYIDESGFEFDMPRRYDYSKSEKQVLWYL